MSGRTLSLVGSIAVVAALFMSGVRVDVPNSARADDCLTAPDSSAPQGSHWYYHTDRASQRKCWHFRAPGDPAQDSTAATSEAAPAEQSPSMPAPFGSTPTPSPSVATAPVWPQVPQPASTTDEGVQRSTRSILETSPGQASTSPQIGAQAGEPAPGPPVAWPDAPPANGTIKAQESTVVTTDAPADSVHSIWTIRSLRLTPKAFLIFAFGLAVIGTLFGILMKMAAARRRRLILTDPDSDQLDKATAGMSGETIKTTMAPSTSSKSTNRPNRGQGTTPVSHSEPTTAETIKTSMASMSKGTNRPNRGQVTAPPVSHSEPTTKGGRDNARDKNEIRNEDDTLAQLNQGLNDLLRAHGST
jgi:hypothetical protein